MKKKLYPYVYILPAFVFVTMVTLLPNFYSLYLSFTNYSLYHFEKFDFIGFKNFKEILFGAELSVFLNVFYWTCAWAALSVGISLTVGLTLAIILNKPDLKGRSFYRTLLIIPWAVPSFITVLMWAGLLNSNFGTVNVALKSLGLSALPWLVEPLWAKISVVMVNLWLTFPFMMSISLGALQSIPCELYEAASIDGANKFKQFKKITIPLLRSSLVPVLITSFAFNFNNFVGIYLLTAGGPAVPGSAAGATDILVSYTYKLAFTLSRYGLSCAYAVLIFLIIGTLSLVNFKITGSFKET